MYIVLHYDYYEDTEPSCVYGPFNSYGEAVIWAEFNKDDGEVNRVWNVIDPKAEPEVTKQ
jgi:hypothetical protein